MIPYRWFARRWAPLAPIALGLVAHSLYFNFLTDDSFISFMYARNFAEHGQLVFNLGDRVDGYTNFLWTVLLGLLMKLDVAPELSSRVLGSAFGIATLVVAVRLSERVRGRATDWDYVPALMLAASSGFACWCSGGLETQMFTFLVSTGLLLYVKRAFAPTGLVLALAALTRPEGVVVFAVIALHRLLEIWFVERRWWPRRADLLAAVAFIALYLPYFAWRWWYYGWPFPNTYYVKAGLGATPHYQRRVWAYGAYYVWQWATQSGALYALPLAAVAVWCYRRFGTLALLLSIVYLGYAAAVGGDFMGLHRFIMPLFVTTALLAALGLAVIVGRIQTRAALRWLGAVATVAVLGGFGWSQFVLSKASMVPRADHGIDRPGYLKLYTHDRGLLGKALLPLLRPDDFSIVGGAGVESYYARMRAIDVFGLVSATIAHKVRPHNPRPGHQKWAPAALLLTYHPTFLFHCYSLHRDPRNYRLCGEAGYFISHGGFEPVTMHVPGLRERGEYYTFLKRRDRSWPGAR